MAGRGAEGNGVDRRGAAWQGRLRATYRSLETKRIHAVLAEMLKIWPGDTAIQNDEAYMRLLLMPMQGGDPAELKAIEELAAGLIQKEPKSLPHRTLLALSRLRQGRADAREAYLNTTISAAVVSPGALAVHTAMLAANSNLEEARKEAAAANLDLLLPEERALFEEFIP